MHIGRQEDAHEFLRYLIEQMEKAYLLRFKNTQGFKEMEQYSKETTPLNQILGGYLRSTVTCMSCKHESITFEHFMDMALDISRFSMLNDALSGYFTRENLEECGYKCESCKKKVSATKQFSLERAPVVLCIQLKRFNVSGGKLGKQIQISQYLDLTKYLAKASEPNQNCQYKLTSMVTHLGGSASGGHYTAIGQGPNGNFYQFDDSCVSMISSEQVMRTNSYVLFYELDKRKMQNGHGSLSHIHQNEHTYSKSASSTSTSSSFNSIDRSFAKPKLPSQMIPTSIMRQNNYLKQKENETTPPTSRNGIGNGPSTSKMANGNSKVSTQLFPAVKPNGKREAGSESDGDEVAAKRIKPSLPSLPRLTNEEQQVSPKVSTSPVPANEVTTPIKPKSLVPYETDDEDEELPPTNGVANGHKKAEAVKLCRTSSGVFVETDWKENNTPSKQGSTIDKTVVTKASQLTNGNGVHPAVNGKTPSTNGFHIIRSDDTIQQLTKLNHSGYGSSEVVSWNNTPTNMNREVDKDQSEDRKRQHEDDDDMEMDAGRVKKIKVRQNYPQSGGKLPNPFQEQQNSQNHNGNFRPPNKYYESPPNGFRNRFQNGNNNYNNSRNFKSGHNGNGNSNGNGNNYSNPKFHPKYGNGKFQNHNGNNKRYFNNHRR